MLLTQYAYFALASETVSADEISARIGLQPDQAVLLGSKDPDIPIPTTHQWMIECRNPDLHLDLQMMDVLDRIAPRAHEIGALVDEGQVWARLQGVREFDSTKVDSTSPDPLVGFSLPLESLVLLTSVSAFIDVDEYAF